MASTHGPCRARMAHLAGALRVMRTARHSAALVALLIAIGRPSHSQNNSNDDGAFVLHADPRPKADEVNWNYALNILCSRELTRLAFFGAVHRGAGDPRHDGEARPIPVGSGRRGCNVAAANSPAGSPVPN